MTLPVAGWGSNICRKPAAIMGRWIEVMRSRFKNVYPHFVTSVSGPKDQTHHRQNGTHHLNSLRVCIPCRRVCLSAIVMHGFTPLDGETTESNCCTKMVRRASFCYAVAWDACIGAPPFNANQLQTNCKPIRKAN